MKIYDAIERQPTEIPISELLSPEGKIEILPDVKAKGLFEIDYRSDQLVVIAGKYIGQIPLSESVVIDVKPKFSISRLLQILERSDEPLKCLEFFQRGYAHSADVSSTIFEALIESFVVSLQPVILEGIWKIYQEKNASSASPKGRLNAWATGTKHLSKGEYHKANFTYFDFVADHSLNRLLAYALWYSGELLAKSGCKNAKLPRRVAYAADFFAGIPIDHTRRFVEESRGMLATSSVPSIRHYYLPACDIALALIGRTSINITERGGDIFLTSFLLDMENIFEQYVRNILREAPTIKAKNLHILDGNSDGKGWLLTDSKKFEAKPDVVIRDRSGCKVILDAKYKPKPKEDDRYQILAHAMSFGASKAVLVGPSAEGWGSGLTRLGKVGPGLNSIGLFTYGLNLENENLDFEEMLFAQSISNLC